MFWHGKIYVGVTVYIQSCGTPRPDPLQEQQSGKVYSSNADLRSWTSLSVPGDIVRFGLGTYHSQLVLAGGKNISARRKVSDVWASDDGTNWQQSESLPPLSVACSMPAIINTGSPEYLLVAGGYDSISEPLIRVDVLMEKQWVSIKPLPKLCCVSSSTIHNGNLYIIGSKSRWDYMYPIYCRLDSLLAACVQARTGEKSVTTAELWKPLNCPFPVSCSASFNKQLLLFVPSVLTIFAYSPLVQSWVHVGDFPKHFQPKLSVVLPSGECLVITGRFSVLKPVLTGMYYS